MPWIQSRKNTETLILEETAGMLFCNSVTFKNHWRMGVVKGIGEFNMGEAERRRWVMQ